MRPGKHEALISFETYQKIQGRLKGHAYVPARKNLSEDFPLRGFVACGDCGKPLTACWSKGRSKHHPYYYCVTKGCESKSKSIRRDVIEGEFETLLKQLTPTKALFGLATDMFKAWWTHLGQTQEHYAKDMEANIVKTQQDIERLVTRVIGTESPSLIDTYEKKITELEAQKIVYEEKRVKQGQPLKPFDNALRTALKFLSDPHKPWACEGLENKRAVLKLTFADRLQYVRNEGFRTAETTLPFKVLGAFDECKSKMARPEGFEPPTTWFVARYSIQLSYGRSFWCIPSQCPLNTFLLWRRERDSNPRYGINRILP